MNVSVGSWICVTAWKIETTRPTTRPGDQERHRHLERDGQGLHRELVTVSAFIGSCQVWNDCTSALDHEVPAVHEHEQQDLERQEMRTGGSIIMPMDMSVRRRPCR